MTAEPMTAERFAAIKARHQEVKRLHGEFWVDAGPTDKDLDAVIAEVERLRATVERLIPEAHDLDSTKCRDRATRQAALSPCQQSPAEWDDDCPACDAQAALSSSPTEEKG